MQRSLHFFPVSIFKLIREKNGKTAERDLCGKCEKDAGQG